MSQQLLAELVELYHQTPEADRHTALAGRLADVDLNAVRAAAAEEFASLDTGTPTEESAAHLLALASIVESAVQVENQPVISDETAEAVADADQAADETAAEVVDADADTAIAEAQTAAADRLRTALDTPAAPVLTAPEPVAVAASVRRPMPVGRLRTPKATVAPEQRNYQFTAAADIPGFGAGQELTNSQQLGKVAQARFSALAKSRGGSAQIARITRTTGTRYDRDDWDTFENIAKESNLSKGNLVAAGGWCAPSETLYGDFCPAASTDGMVDLPTLTTSRGGVKFPVVSDFSALYSAVGFHLTEAEVEAGTEKTCIEIDCPTWQECRLDVDGVCVTSPILTERAYPEAVAHFMENVLAAHAHKINAFKLASMAAGATKVTIAATADADCQGPGALPTVLSAIELQVQDIRYKYRLARNATLELVAPEWLRGVLRADLTKTNGDSNYEASDADLDRYLRLRGVAPQWVLDWQDALATGTDTDFGGKTAPTCWPSKAQVLLYPAGTFTLIQQDVIELDAVYDSTLLKQNRFTKLFTEEGLVVCKRCYDARLIDFTLCPNGARGAAVATACVAP